MHLIVGQFNDTYQPIMDGVANVVKNYAHWINHKYGKAYVITPAYPQYVDQEDFEVLRYHSIAIPKRPPYRFGMPALDINFMKKINKIPFNIVHAHCPFTSGNIALGIAKRKGIPIVGSFHSKYYDDFKEAFKVDQVAKYLVKRVISYYNSMDFVWTVNHASVDTLKEYGFKGQVEVIHNGTDFIPPSDSKKACEIVNEKLGIGAHENVFLFVGQHIWQKNVKLTLECLYELKKQGIPFKMLFAGTGNAENEMKAMVKQMDMENEVKFLGLVLDREFLKSLFCRADLFLFPSVYDNAPIVVREAAAVGCPSIVIEGSNASEGIRDEYNGYTTHENALEYALKIKSILKDEQKLLEVGKAAQVSVYQKWENIIEEVTGRYHEIIKSFHSYNVSVKA